MNSFRCLRIHTRRSFYVYANSRACTILRVSSRSAATCRQSTRVLIRRYVCHDRDSAPGCSCASSYIFGLLPQATYTEGSNTVYLCKRKPAISCRSYQVEGTRAYSVDIELFQNMTLYTSSRAPVATVLCAHEHEHRHSGARVTKSKAPAASCTQHQTLCNERSFGYTTKLKCALRLSHSVAAAAR
uniref:Uncharacterized protein n=1 Tax=Trichogramma kaykai TaxID=54128 RepID=A0ABD2WQN6_9HYME